MNGNLSPLFNPDKLTTLSENPNTNINGVFVERFVTGRDTEYLDLTVSLQATWASTSVL